MKLKTSTEICAPHSQRAMLSIFTQKKNSMIPETRVLSSNCKFPNVFTKWFEGRDPQNRKQIDAQHFSLGKQRIAFFFFLLVLLQTLMPDTLGYKLKTLKPLSSKLAVRRVMYT